MDEIDISTAHGSIETIIKEVGSENRKIVFEVLDECMRNKDTILFHGTVREGIDHVVSKTRARLPKEPPKPQDPGELNTGFAYSEPAPVKDGGLLDAMRQRRKRIWGRGRPVGSAR